MMTRRHFLQATPGLLAAATASPRLLGAPTSTLTPPEIGRSTRIAKPGDGMAKLDLGRKQSLRLLQFTDNHFFCGVESGLQKTDDDQATVRDWQNFVRIFKPDLVVSSGDLWHDNPGGRGQATLEYTVARLSELGVPWATCWGNHDQLDDFQRGHDALEAAKNSFYRGGATHGDYYLEMMGSDAAGVSKPMAHLFLMNTNRFGLTDWQLAWLKTTQAQLKARNAKPLPALAFFHIPVFQQKSLYREKVTLGSCQEEVCFEKESGEAVPVLAGANTIRATFCGHDHTNDYAVRDRGVDLNYGRATGYSGYGGEKLKKGAKLIELDLATGAYTQTTVFADGSKWKPA
ncbi:MAG TPA: metallophosphoesterase [Candidatus Limnocylindria bacterium]|nr:metallophosphoesterase [Candidatus Limnocylindria bacterium]